MRFARSAKWGARANRLPDADLFDLVVSLAGPASPQAEGVRAYPELPGLLRSYRVSPALMLATRHPDTLLKWRTGGRAAARCTWIRMPITCERDDSRRYMVARATGLVLPHELLEFIRKERTGAYGRYALLFDATAARTRARPGDIELVLRQVLTDSGPERTRGPVAIVAKDQVLHLATLYETACHGAGLHVIRVFRDSGTAERWLEEQMQTYADRGIR